MEKQLEPLAELLPPFPRGSGPRLGALTSLGFWTWQRQSKRKKEGSKKFPPDRAFEASSACPFCAVQTVPAFPPGRLHIGLPTPDGRHPQPW